MLHAEKTIYKRKSFILFFYLFDKLLNSLFVIAYLYVKLNSIINN